MKKNCIKSDCKEICFKLVASDRSDKRFLLTSQFCPLGLSAPDLRLHTFIKSGEQFRTNGPLVCYLSNFAGLCNRKKLFFVTTFLKRDNEMF